MEKMKLFFKNNWFFLLAIIYLIIPTDFIPDIIPILGKVDDTILLLIEVIKRVKESNSNEKIGS